ncbi:uncharacterized protein LOC113493065 [Trichoplusia ni]|uniref:Uncharacterized protein LOC113493065 n=1 Tax=Trichoplusia ni TaxID=7111 RepID=A0A7E5VED7_TRINI|nr:uncharacterized protein LOC113493065 [Trichoplusia ni]
MPDYFKRQLCARLRRVVIFPGKCIVREGDTFTTTYFVHQGELEKWYNDASGEGKLLSVLYTNGYFGCITGLFPNRKNEFTYYARTVVDLVHLDLDNWRDLLAAYPDLKAVLYNATREIRQEYARENYGKGKSFSA